MAGRTPVPGPVDRHRWFCPWREGAFWWTSLLVGPATCRQDAGDPRARHGHRLYRPSPARSRGGGRHRSVLSLSKGEVVPGGGLLATGRSEPQARISNAGDLATIAVWVIPSIAALPAARHGHRACPKGGQRDRWSCPVLGPHMTCRRKHSWARDPDRIAPISQLCQMRGGPSLGRVSDPPRAEPNPQLGDLSTSGRKV